MADVFQCVTNLLGQPEGSPALTEIQDHLRESPKITDQQRILFYSFPESGLEILFDRRLNRFTTGIFFLSGNPIQSGAFKQFKGPLVSGVDAEDSREQVNSKIGIKPFESRQSGDYWDRYELTDMQIQFVFDAVDKKMKSIMIQHTDPSEGESPSVV